MSETLDLLKNVSDEVVKRPRKPSEILPAYLGINPCCSATTQDIAEKLQQIKDKMRAPDAPPE
jgi:hypothetical protein